MTANLKTIVAVTGAVAMLASPVLAKNPGRHSGVVVPADARASAFQPYAPAHMVPAQTVYAPDLRLPARPYQDGGIIPDFQLSHQ